VLDPFYVNLLMVSKHIHWSTRSYYEFIMYLEIFLIFPFLFFVYDECPYNCISWVAHEQKKKK